MLTYMLKEIKDEIKSFYFFPDNNRNAAGIVSFNVKNKERWVDLHSSADIKGYYADHALTGIDVNKSEGTVAWC